MGLKRKVSKASKVSKVPVESKSPASPKLEGVANERTAEQIIIENGTLADNLLKSKEWQVIVAPQINERIASICGRFTNGRFYHGSFTRRDDNLGLEFQQGYQKALMDLSNDVMDFIAAKDNLEKQRVAEIKAAEQPMVSPMEEE